MLTTTAKVGCHSNLPWSERLAFYLVVLCFIYLCNFYSELFEVMCCSCDDECYLSSCECKQATFDDNFRDYYDAVTSSMKQQSHAEHFSKPRNKPISLTLQKNFPFIDNRLNKLSFPLFWSDLGDEKLEFLISGIVTQCTSKCNCHKKSKNCSNSVTENGLSVQLKIALHPDKRDWHVVADEDIKQGTYLGEFS